jgi:hypothetical protein
VADYFMPLSTILGTFGLENWPVVGYAEPLLRAIEHHVGVRTWKDTWNDTHTMVSGTAVLSKALDLGKKDGWGLSIGEPGGGTTEFRFEMSAARTPILAALLDLYDELDGVEDPAEAEGKLQFFLRSDALPFSFRLSLHDLSVSVRLPKAAVKKGQVENDEDGRPMRIIPAADDGPVEITLASATLILDTERGWAIEVDENQLLNAPPFLIPNTHVGFLAQKIRIDLSESSGFAEVLARPGYDETWRGVYIEKFVVFGLDSVFPTAPKMIDPANEDVEEGLVLELSKWLIGTNGLSGSLRLTLNNTAGPLDTLSIDIELDRGNPIRFGGEVTLYGGRLGDDDSFASLGPAGNLLIGFNVRFHPEGGSLVEFVLRTPGTADSGLFTIRKMVPEAVLLAVMVTALAAGAVSVVGFLAILLPVFLRFVDIQSITLDALRIRQRYIPLAGRELIVYDFVFDVQVKLQLDLPLGTLGLPNIHTREDHPVGALLRGLTLSWATNFDEFTPAETAGREKISFDFDTEAGITFQVGEESPVEGSTITVVELGAGRWDLGMWLDVGLRFQGGGDTAFAVTPSVIRFWFLANGDPDHVSMKGAGFSFLIPGVMFSRGVLDVGGDTTNITGHAFICATKPDAVAHPEKRENWLMEVAFGMRKQMVARPDGTEVESRIYAFAFEHSGGLPLPFVPGTSLYGISGIGGDNVRPALGAAGPADWLMNQAPPNVAHDISKWEGAPDEWGFGAGLVLGATADRGRPWNLKGGLLYLKPGPVIALHGGLNLFKAAEKVDDTSSAELLAAVVVDLFRHEFTIAFRATKKVPPPGGKILSLTVPAELQINEQGFHLYLGEHWPPAKHVRAKLLDKFEISGYVMFDTATIANLADTGVDVPGFALALGVRFDYEGGKKGGRFKLYFVLRAGADLAFSGNSPSLFFIRAFLTGGVVAKAWGIGFELNVSAEFLWVRPEPDLLTGKLKITLDLPWPIPNLKLTIDVSRGSDGLTEALTAAVEGLVLIPRNRNESIPFPVTGELTDVPIDPVLSLTFSFTTRNAASIAGSFQPDGANLSTWHSTSGDRGYAVEVKAIRLFAHDPGGGLVPVGTQIPARWRQEPLPAAGGQPSRRVLELFTYDGGSERLIGASAEYVEWATGNWDPCPPATDPQPVCYDFESEELGAIVDERRVRSGGDPRLLRVAPDEEPEGAESSLRFFGATSVAAEVVQPGIDDSGFERAIQLPAPRGVADPDAIAAPALRLAFAVANEATLDFLRLDGGTITVQCYRRGLLVGTVAEGQHLGWAERKYERVRYSVKGPVDRLDVTAMYPSAVELAPAYLSHVCLLYTGDVREHLDAAENALAFNEFWSSLLDSDAAASDALLLEPATRYTLRIESSWARIAEGEETPAAAPITHSFTFVTVPADRPPLDLRGPEGAVSPGDWDVRTVPAHQQSGVYPDRPIRLEFRDARGESVYAKFHRRLVLRLVDEDGQDLFERLAFLREHALELPEFHRVWRDRLLEVACAPDIDELFVTGVAHFPSILSTDRWYDGTLVLLPDTVTDPSTVVDWDVHPVAHRFRFRTSRWSSLTAHANAYAARVLDELCEEPPDLAALAALTGRRTSGQLLETVMGDQLHLVERRPAARPEIVRIWRQAGSSPGDVALVAVLLDGPEAFLRAAGALAVRDSSAAAVPFALVENESFTRTLVLPRAPGVTWSELRITITAAFTGADGTTVTEDANLVLPVPPRPAFLEEEPAP